MLRNQIENVLIRLDPKGASAWSKLCAKIAEFADKQMVANRFFDELSG